MQLDRVTFGCGFTRPSDMGAGRVTIVLDKTHSVEWYSTRPSSIGAKIFCFGHTWSSETLLGRLEEWSSRVAVTELVKALYFDSLYLEHATFDWADYFFYLTVSWPSFQWWNSSLVSDRLRHLKFLQKLTIFYTFSTTISISFSSAINQFRVKQKITSKLDN